jgi:hypothetical protein
MHTPRDCRAWKPAAAEGRRARQDDLGDPTDLVIRYEKSYLKHDMQYACWEGLHAKVPRRRAGMFATLCAHAVCTHRSQLLAEVQHSRASPPGAPGGAARARALDALRGAH